MEGQLSHTGTCPRLPAGCRAVRSSSRTPSHSIAASLTHHSPFNTWRPSPTLHTAPAPSQVILCHNRLSTFKEVELAVAHELVHAYDFCRAENLDLKNCSHHACTEVRSGVGGWQVQGLRHRAATPSNTRLLTACPHLPPPHPSTPAATAPPDTCGGAVGRLRAVSRVCAWQLE
jgi:hypothetical protein